MGYRSKEVRRSSESDKQARPARCHGIAVKGIKTSLDFSAFMSALMSDVISGAVSPGVGNAACNAGGKLLKVVELQMRYGKSIMPNGSKVLYLNGAHL